MTVATPRPFAPVDPLAWQARAACRDVPLTELDLTWDWDETYPEDLAAARALCKGCEVIGQCRAVALAYTDVAGVAAGMTEQERARVRVQRGITVTSVSPADVLTGPEFAPEWSHTSKGQRLPAEFVHQVGQMTADGLTARDIADLLAGSIPGVEITMKTVAYARQLLAGTRTRSAS